MDDCKTCQHNKGTCSLHLFPHGEFDCPEFVVLKPELQKGRRFIEVIKINNTGESL